MEESSSMAETAIIYRNVADGLDTVEEASQSIISTMAAFGIESSNTMSIIDKFNEVGNNFSITSAGIGDALQRSASALYASGNTIDESIALITAANQVVQNPEVVGTAFKTLSLRLRGAKTELEEAGLETDAMAESTSQLQAKLKALTGGKVDIMADADSFKSTTQILREMAAVWDDMSDIDQAAALELMGGKRQANVLASLLNNFETVESAIETSMNSSGSAIAENEKWLDSIEGKTYQFTNALQTMWSNMLDSEVIKGFIDFGTDAIQFLDTGVGKAIAFVAALKLMAKFKGFSIKGITQGLGDTIKNITTAQQTLQALGKTTPINSGYDLTNINAYAQAVAGLTAKQQANLLASQGLNQEQIKYALTLNQVDDAAMREAMAHTRAATAKQQENIVGAQSIQQKALEVAASLQVQAAKDGETRSAELNAAANILEQATSEDLTRDKLVEIMTSKGISSATQAEILAKLGLTNVNKGLVASIKALYVLNPVGFWITVGSTILSLIPILGKVVGAFTKSADEIKQEAQEISKTYKDAVDEVNNNLQSLGVTNDSTSIGALEKEFATLTAGVDKYGNNLSLTSDQYERYRDICEQIVGINPLIASGYDSATEAIGNNASVLSGLIELQKMQARLAAAEYVNDENLQVLTEDAVNDYKKATQTVGQAGLDLQDDLSSVFFNIFGANDTDSNGSAEDELITSVLYQLGHTSEEINKIMSQYEIFDGSTYTYNIRKFWSDYQDEIKNNIAAFGDEYIDDISKVFSDSEQKFKAAEAKLSEAQDGLIDTLLIAPTSSDDYDKLSSEGKNFLVDWIKTSDLFKVDGDLTDEEVKKMKETILNMMDILVSDVKNIEYNGEKFTAQELLSQIYNLDPSSVNYEDYKKQIKELLTSFWNSLTDAQKKEYGFEKFEDFTISLGFDFVLDNEDGAESKMISRYANIKGITEDEAREYFNSLPAVVVKRLLAIDWDTVDESNVDDLINNAQRNIISSKTYSVLVESAESYNDILSQTSEIVADNTEVSQEYKDSLIDLGISQEELNECFDEANPLIVKNAKALNKLVKEANKNVAANVKLAKSNARLEYYDLVKQLNSALDGTRKLDSATRDSVYSTIAQIDAVQKAIYQYRLLEDSLLGAQNAFKEFNEAKEIDDLNTYGDSYVEMVQTMYDGLYKTGQVGTEQFWAAVENLVPTEVYQGLKEDSDRMKAIYDYYNKEILPSLHLEEDQFSMDYASIENFVKKAIDAKVFTGDRKDFDLVEGMNLEKAAELMGMTTAQAYAFFAELDKYNTSSTEPSFLLQLDDSLEGRITKVSNKIEDLNKQKLALLEDDGYDKNQKKIDEINDRLSESSEELNVLRQEAYKTWQEYTKTDAVIAALSEVEDKQRKITKDEANTLGLEWDEVKGQTVQQVLDTLLAKQLKLEEPTVLTAQLAIENIDTQIAELKGKIEQINQNPSIRPNIKEAKTAELEAQIQKLEEDKVTIATTFGIELSDEDKKDLEDELNSIEKFKIHDKEFTVVAKGTSEVMKLLDAVNQYAKDITKTVTTEYKTVYTSDNKQYSGWTHTSGSGGRYTRADGTAHANGAAHATGSWGAPRTETALVGELGPELLVRNGRWHTIGENGAEFTQVQRGDIIFNHKQTEDLLSKGYVTGRGKLHGGSSAFASGTAYSGTWRPTSQNKEQSNKPGNDFTKAGNRLFNAADSLSTAAGSASDAADEFREVFDWIAVRLEEINEEIDLRSAQLENEIDHSAQNKVIDSMIDLNQKLYDNLIAGKNKYYAYAEKLLAKVPKAYRDAAQDGTIAIEEFIGKTDEKTLEAIQEYRDWVQKGADATQQAEETLTEISTLAKQAIDNIASDYENKKSLSDNKIDQYDAYNALLETDKGFESTSVYQAMIEENNKNIATLQQQRDKMQAELNKRVQSGEIKKYSQDWYDAVNDIATVDTEIIELTTDTENYQDAINELHWEKFDALMKRIELVSEETENLIDILSNKDVVDEGGVWTEEGITSLGLYAQQMEAAEVQAKKYEEEIKYLNKNWQKLGYTEEEYIDKLDELKSGQYDAIKAYHDSKDAIVDLNKERVDAVKEGIEKEIEAYEELIEKKKEELDAEKDLYDFQKSIMEQEKDIADLDRQLAALSSDNSSAARAKRAQLEAELAEANAALQDSYYERSVSNQQEALDKELENFKDEKDAEIEGWDKYLENTEQVIADSLSTIQANTDVVYQTLQEMVQEYGLNIQNSITGAIIDPWAEGSTAIQSFSEQFGVSMSETVEELENLAIHFKETMLEIEQAGVNATNAVKANAQGYTNAEYQAPKKEEPKKENNKKQEEQKTIKVGGKINAGSAKIYDYVGDKSGAKQYYSSDPIYTVLEEKSGYLRVRHHKSSKGTTGWFKKSDVKALASGTKNLDKSGIVNIDELGEELILRAQNGRLTYLEKGSGVVPADLTSNLMEWGKLDPSIMLDQNRPSIAPSKSIVNNNMEINVDASVGTLIRVDHLDGNNPDEVIKLVDKAWDKKMAGLNNAIKKFTR
jgi:TP901 family phage tail tape measure protein